MDTENRWQNRVISYCHFRRIIHFAESLKLFISCPVAKVTNVYRCKYDNFILIWGQIVGDWKKMAEIIAFRDKTSFAKTCQFTNCRKLPFLKLSSICDTTVLWKLYGKINILVLFIGYIHSDKWTKLSIFHLSIRFHSNGYP